MTEENTKTVKRKLSTSSFTSECSTSSLTPLPTNDSGEVSEKINDNELFSAAEALTQLTRSVSPSLLVNSLLPTSTSTVVTADFERDERNRGEGNTLQGEHPLVAKVNKVSKHPIVTNAVKYYENSKRNYGAFNYAAGIVEKAAIPVVNKIEVNLNNRHHAKQLKVASRSKTPPGVKKRRIGATDYNKVVTMETKKRLQFCLHLLRLANDRINYKVNFLQQKVIDKERSIKEKRLNNNSSTQPSDITNEKVRDEQDPNEEHESNTSNTDNIADDCIAPESQSEAQQTKTEIVATVKKIIHVISTFKPSSLRPNTDSPEAGDLDSVSRPEDIEFKSTIRDIILKLPNTIQQAAITNNASAQQANDRIFVFAKESLEMITRLTNVFNGQLEHAENWLAKEMQKERERLGRMEPKQIASNRPAIDQNDIEVTGLQQKKIGPVEATPDMQKSEKQVIQD